MCDAWVALLASVRYQHSAPTVQITASVGSGSIFLSQSRAAAGHPWGGVHPAAVQEHGDGQHQSSNGHAAPLPHHHPGASHLLRARQDL